MQVRALRVVSYYLSCLSQVIQSDKNIITHNPTFTITKKHRLKKRIPARTEPLPYSEHGNMHTICRSGFNTRPFFETVLFALLNRSFFILVNYNSGNMNIDLVYRLAGH